MFLKYDIAAPINQNKEILLAAETSVCSALVDNRPYLKYEPGSRTWQLRQIILARPMAMV